MALPWKHLSDISSGSDLAMNNKNTYDPFYGFSNADVYC